MLDGKKTYGASVVAATGGAIVFLQNHITWQEMLSVCAFAVTFVVLRLAIAGAKASSDKNTELLVKLLNKK